MGRWMECVCVCVCVCVCGGEEVGVNPGNDLIQIEDRNVNQALLSHKGRSPR